MKATNPKAEVFSNMTGTTSAAWNDPTRGGELAKAQFAKGADVIFAAAGGTGTGVYQAAKDASKLAIGVDSNQNHVQPGTMLTSMVKRVDVAVYTALKKLDARRAGAGPEGRRRGLRARRAQRQAHPRRHVPRSMPSRPTSWPARSGRGLHGRFGM